MYWINFSLYVRSRFTGILNLGRLESFGVGCTLRGHELGPWSLVLDPWSLVLSL